MGLLSCYAKVRKLFTPWDLFFLYTKRVIFFIIAASGNLWICTLCAETPCETSLRSYFIRLTFNHFSKIQGAEWKTDCSNRFTVIIQIVSDCSWSWAAVLVCDFNCQSSFYTLSLFNPKAKILFSVDTWHFCYFASLNLGEGIKKWKRMEGRCFWSNYT